MTLVAPEIRERRKPARGWRGWRGPTEQKPFPSLGWLLLDWTYGFLPDPTREDQPLVYTDEQARRIVEFYELDPVSGEYVNQTDIEEEAKGFGKSPFAGSGAIKQYAGPVCFDGWDADGEPVGVPWGTNGRPIPWVQIAAVSEDQTDNTWGAMYGMLAARGGRIADDLRLDLGRTKVYHRDYPAAVLEPVTASSGSRTGQRIVYAVLDETWLWTKRNGGTALAVAIRANLTKMNGRSMETTNAPVLGQQSVAEQSDPDHVARGVLHHARRPQTSPDPSWPDERLEAELAHVYAHVPWINPRRLVADIRKPTSAWDDSLRLFFNIRTSGAGRAVDPRLWELRRAEQDVPSGTRIGLGFDGSISQDATVLRGCLPDGYSFVIGAWEKPSGDDLVAWMADNPGASEWMVDRTDVHQAVADAFATYDVGLMLCDTPKWYSEIEAWQRLYGDDLVTPFDTNQPRKFAPAVDRWLTALREGSHTHDGHPLTDRHVKAAHLRAVRLADDEADGRTRYVLVKGDDKGRIDAAVADVLAYEAAMTMPDAAEREPEFFAI